jgi:hypothetical protein
MLSDTTALDGASELLRPISGDTAPQGGSASNRARQPVDYAP